MPPRTTGTLRVPRKRSRRGSESTTPDPELRLPDNVTKDEDFWFTDGNIVLVAQDVAFCVYKGPLMRHSTVFQDMFAFPQPEPRAAEARADRQELPVITLYDAPHDVRHFLRRFVAADSLRQNGKDVSDIHAISAWIRLGHKYQIDELVEEGLAILHEHYPDSLPSTLSRSSDFSGLKAIAVVNLARLIGKTSLLPTALLACCCLEAEIVKGFEREDGTRERLDPEDLGRCYAAKATLIRTTTASIVSLLDGFPPYSCEDPQKCEDQRRVNLEYLMETLYADILPDTLFVEQECEEIVAPTWCTFCGPCRSVLKSQIQDERRTLWNELPRILDVAVDLSWLNVDMMMC